VLTCGEIAAPNLGRHVSAVQSYPAASGVSQVRPSLRIENRVSVVCDVTRRLMLAKHPIEQQLALFK